MFLFYHSEQNEKSGSYYKGLLFEALLDNYLTNLGYSVELRRKHNSLEYDLEGSNIATDRKIVGEAKAINKNVSGPVLTSFVGKLIPLGINEKIIDGLFLSTSPLTAEADEYYQSIKRYGVKCIAGKDLFDSVCDTLSLPKIDTLIEGFFAQEYEVQSQFLLKTDTGLFMVLISGTTSSVAPTYFTLFNSNAVPVTDMVFLNKLSDEIPEFISLKPLIKPNAVISELKEEQRIIPFGLTVGTNWTDFRLPAGPEYYVGREELINEIINDLQYKKESNIIQIKSRSGVGKSSTLAVLENRFKLLNFHTELHDSRDIKSVLDFKAIIRRFVNSPNTPQDMREVDEKLSAYANILGENKAVFIVDQFESTFQKPEVFDAYETLASYFLKYDNNLYFCLARKNDQITTYDETRISLERFNSISKHYELKDFTQTEAAKLIDNINNYSAIQVGNDILSYVLEFAQGFPWLIKRAMAHIIKLSTQALIPQSELFATGLKLNDLFEEEIEGLDEIEKEYLYKIAARLPSDYHQLQRSFDDDPLLPNILDKLTQSRLLRMTGATYDTYNDVFKEYLVYRKLPEFRQSIIYRKHPYGVISTFLSVIEKVSFTIEELETLLNTGRGALFNNIKEWRNLSLIEKEGDLWSVPKKVIDAYRKEMLGDYIRRTVLENDIVVRLLNILNKQDDFTSGDLPKFLKDQFPFVGATDQTWVLYSNILKSWLTNLDIVEINKDTVLKPSQISREDIFNKLGNLNSISMSKRGVHEIFLPSVSWANVEACFYDLLSGVTNFKGEKQKALNDLKNGEWFDGTRLVFNDFDTFKKEVKEILIADPYTAIWEAAENQTPLLPIIKNLISGDYSDVTMRWRLKRLINWAKALGILDNRRYKY